MILLIISFYLENIFFNSINCNFLIPLFILMSFVIIYPYMYSSKKKYLISILIIGIIYDITYTDTLFLNSLLFLLIGYFIIIMNKYINNNLINTLLIDLLVIIIYRVAIYLFLVFVNYINRNTNDLFISITNSLLINIIYSVILYELLKIIAKKREIYKLK